MIEIKKSGNLLEEHVEAYINTVNCVGIMGKGIALQFKQAYPDNYNAYKNACNKNEVQIGKMFVFELNSLMEKKYIINFPTKKHWKEKSEIDYIEKGLDDLVSVIDKYKIKSIAIPPLGCGYGGLDWKSVKPIILSKLDRIKSIKIELFEPSDYPEPGKIKINTKEPKLTPPRAALIGLLSEYIKFGDDITNLVVQKLMYFLQEAGEPLKLRYEKNKYGPYANNLNHVLQRLDGHYITGYGDHSSDSVIKLNKEKLEKGLEYLKNYNETLQRFNKVINLIQGYESPYGLELLATVHWVIKKENITEENSIIDYIQKWNERKKSLFTPAHIRKAINKINNSDINQILP